MAEGSRGNQIVSSSYPSSSSAYSSSSSSSCRDSSSITQMSHDQIISILQLLPIESVLSFSMTCRKFRSLGCSDALWESICRREWGRGPVDTTLGTLSSESRGLSWKRLYQQVAQLSSLSYTRLSSREGIFPKPRGSHSLNFVSDCLVLYGGGCDGGRHLDDTWVAYVGQGSRMLGRFGHTCIVISDALVLFGGINDNGVRHSDTWIGRLSCDMSSEIKLAWKLLDVEHTLPPPRGAHASCSFGEEKMIIHGGIGPGGLRLSDMWMLDLSNGFKSGRWHQIVTPQPSPAARSGHSLTWAGESSMVLFGGRGTGYEALNDIWVLDMEGDGPEWVQIACERPGSVPRGLPLPRVGHSATLVLGGKVLIYGGEDSQRRRKNDFWLLDLKTLLALRRRLQNTSLKRVAKKMWKRLKAEGMQQDRRSFHAACADQSGRRLFIFGGMVDGIVHPAEACGLRFDGGLFLVELVLQL
ncbi:unnamed protein product [Spirodela intermedia]|uniref:F-box domain-containing protein n=1 Tax=Spirodela intermedia TaxID=51605 RepID=A0A7I8IX47_SPIIN|nr:unnamed protein product [Spirodela intermedia]CAA6662352.1 unnamed protein product [Spirodela intermedia]